MTTATRKSRTTRLISRNNASNDRKAVADKLMLAMRVLVISHRDGDAEAVALVNSEVGAMGFHAVTKG